MLCRWQGHFLRLLPILHRPQCNRCLLHPRQLCHSLAELWPLLHTRQHNPSPQRCIDSVSRTFDPTDVAYRAKFLKTRSMYTFDNRLQMCSTCNMLTGRVSSLSLSHMRSNLHNNWTQHLMRMVIPRQCRQPFLRLQRPTSW